MTDLTTLRMYYADMSDEELLDTSAAGAEAYVPDTWSIIENEMASRCLVPRPARIVVPDVEVDPEPIRQARAPAEHVAFGAKTAYATAAYFALYASFGVYLHWSPRYILFSLAAAMFYVAAAVRIKRRHSVRAASLALACALALMLDEGYLGVVGRRWEFHFSKMALFALIAYALAEARWAATSLRDERDETSLVPPPPDDATTP